MSNILVTHATFLPSKDFLESTERSIKSLNLLKSSNHNITFRFSGFTKSISTFNKCIDLLKAPKLAIPLSQNYGKAYCINNISKDINNFDYMLSLDGDIAINETKNNFIDTLVEAANNLSQHDQKSFGVLGIEQTLSSCHLYKDLTESFEYNSYRYKRTPKSPSNIAGGAVFVSSKAWKDIKGYRLLNVYGGDDAYLFFDTFKLGYAIALLHNKISVTHPGTTDEDYNTWKKDEVRKALSKEDYTKNVEKSTMMW